jgi:DNA-binding NarL/FixJ family response regulator
VFVVDDHPVFREGLVTIIQQMPHLHVCGEASNATQAFEGISRLNPDLVLMDISLPGKSGLELLQDVHALKPDLPVLVISMHDESLYAERVLRAGGRGFIMKHEDPKEIALAINKVLKGHVYASSRIAETILDVFAHARPLTGTSDISKLTNRELEVLSLTGRGKDSHDVAQELHISLKTVDTHRANLKAKLKLRNNTELVHYAVRWAGQQC